MSHLGGSLPVQGAVELVDCWGDLQSGLEDDLLPLEADVLGPLDESRQIPLGLDILTNAKVPGSLLEEGVDHPLGFWLLHSQGGGCHLLPLLTFFLDHF